MRVHITLDDELVARLDRRVGSRARSGYIAASVRTALENEERWERVESAIGTVAGEGHDWDEDPARWVAEQRRTDPGRVG